MDKDKAVEISRVVNEIKRCEDFIEKLDDRSYPDEFAIKYRGLEICELEKDVLGMIIDHYKNKLETLNEKLKTM